MEIRVVVCQVAVVLRGHQAALDKVAPGVEPQQGHGAFAEQIGVAAGFELVDAVVLAAKGDEAADGRIVAALDVAAQELAALGEANGVDGRGRGENWVLGEGGAYGLDLCGDVAEEGR